MLLAPPAILGWLGWRHRWMGEDAFIFLRVVDNVLAGRGPVWNASERVEIYTSPLWVGLLSAAGALFPAVSLEWIAVLLGLSCSVAGMFAAQRGALWLADAQRRAGLAWPLGALVVVALPPYWDFATSGLETGLTAAWLGIAFWALARLCSRREQAEAATDLQEGSPVPRPRESLDGPARWVAALIGLGPLIRPDLALMSGGFFLVLLVLHRSHRGLRRLELAAIALAIPIAYQLFRMGYFAALVPNSALAKEAFGSYWSQGWRYLTDFTAVYWLWLPVAALGACWASALGAAWRARRWPTVALTLAPVVSGLLHALYVVRLGGDFMHGRLLLPSLFTVLLPVFAVGRAGRWQRGLAALVVVPWAIACALWLRVPYATEIGPGGIADERGVHVAYIGRSHPVTVDDYGAAFVTRDGRRLRALAAEHRALVLGGEMRWDSPGPEPQSDLELAPRVTARIVSGRLLVGLLGYSAGPDVHLVDRLGLGDPVAARLRLDRRGRPGHEKFLSDAWIVGRFADPAAPLPDGAPGAASVDAARAALACPPLKTLLEAVEGPLTAARFVANPGVAWRSRTLRIPADPAQAATELCRPD